MIRMFDLLLIVVSHCNYLLQVLTGVMMGCLDSELTFGCFLFLWILFMASYWVCDTEAV